MSRFLTVFACLMLLSGAAAKKGDVGTVKSDKGKDPRNRDRTVDIKNTGKKVMATSRSVSDDEDEFDFEFSIAGYPSIRLKYSRTDDDNNKTKVSYRVGLFEIVEVDDHNGPFDTSSYVKLTGGTSDWEDVVLVTTDVDNGNGTIYNATTTRKFSSGMSVRWETLFTTTRSNISEIELRPGAVKFSFAIDNFPYQFSNSQLGILARITAQNTSYDEGDSSLEFGDGLVTWNDWVMADGENVSLSAVGKPTQTIHSTVPGDGNSEAGEGTRFLVYMINATQPTSILWDPEMTVTDSALGIESASSSAPALLLLLAAIVQCLVL